MCAYRLNTEQNPKSDPTSLVQPGGLDGRMLELLCRSSRREGFEAGYRRAAHEVLASAVLLAERTLRRQDADGGGADVRRALYAFVEELERSLPTPRDEGFDGGLGI